MPGHLPVLAPAIVWFKGVGEILVTHADAVVFQYEVNLPRLRNRRKVSFRRRCLDWNLMEFVMRFRSSWARAYRSVVACLF